MHQQIISSFSLVLKQLAKLIAKGISDIASAENVFSNSIPTYLEAISKSGFDDTSTYNTEANVCDNSEKNLKKIYMVYCIILIKCRNKRGENILGACKETSSKRNFSIQDF